MSIASDPFSMDGLTGGDVELSHSRELTDSGNADRLVDLHAARIRYVPGIGWFLWNGNRWEQDETGELLRLARNVVATIHEQAAAVPESDDHHGRLKKHAKSSGQAHKLKAMVEVAAVDERVVVTAKQLDSDPYALNTQSGIIDLRTGKLRAHEPSELHTLITTAGYAPDAPMPVFSTFLDRITDGNKAMQEFLQRLFGLALIGEVLEHYLPIFQGDGANGKSTLINAVTHALGEYAHVASADLLMAGRRSTEGATPSIAALRGRRIVTVSETSEDARLAIERVKAITGGDVVTGRFLNQNPIKFRPSHTIILLTNHRPRVQDDSVAIWRRLLLVLFGVSIPEAEQDRDLERKLRGEQDAILAWQVAGAVQYLRNGLRPPAEVTTETEHYRDSENTFKAWLAECTERAPADYGEKASELLHSFNAWAKDNRAQPLTKMSMAERLKRAEFTLKPRMDANYYLGIRLPDSDSGQTGFPESQAEYGDHGDLCGELPTRAPALAQGERLGKVSTVSTESGVEVAAPEGLFAPAPDVELDRFAPLTPAERQWSERQPPGTACAAAGIAAHAALPPPHPSSAEWEHRGEDDDLPLLKKRGNS